MTFYHTITINKIGYNSCITSLLIFFFIPADHSTLIKNKDLKANKLSDPY